MRSNVAHVVGVPELYCNTGTGTGPGTGTGTGTGPDIGTGLGVGTRTAVTLAVQDEGTPKADPTARHAESGTEDGATVVVGANCELLSPLDAVDASVLARLARLFAASRVASSSTIVLRKLR